MDNTKRLIATLMLAALLTVFYSCNKENNTKNKAELMMIKSDDLNYYLLQFKAKMQSLSKNNEALELEDALWHLEAMLNYTYGDADYQTSDIQCDTITSNLNITNNTITMAQLNETFNTICGKIEKTYNDCLLPEKSVLAIKTIVQDNNNSYNTIKSVLIVRGLTIPYLWFDSTDYWDEYYYEDVGYVSGGGKCGPYSGQCLDSGAPNELTKKANLRIPQYGCPDGFQVYFTDIEDICVFPTDCDPFLYDENSPCHCKLYINPQDPNNPYHNPSHCIPPEDLNYYISKFVELMNYYKPSGKVAISAKYIYDTIPSIPGTFMIGLCITYAEVHFRPIGNDL